MLMRRALLFEKLLKIIKQNDQGDLELMGSTDSFSANLYSLFQKLENITCTTDEFYERTNGIPWNQLISSTTRCTMEMSRGICKSMNLQIPRNEFANSVCYQFFTTRNMQIDEKTNWPSRMLLVCYYVCFGTNCDIY